MNATQFIEALEALEPPQYQAILEGASLVMQNDMALTLGKSEQPFVVFELGDEQFDSTQALKASLIERAEALITEYYQFNPVSKSHFNQQLSKLIGVHGADALVSCPGKPAELKLFVDQGTLVVEGMDSPRFKYGISLSLNEDYPPTAVENKVRNWLASDHAYGDYISVNVCRFSSMEAA